MSKQITDQELTALLAEVETSIDGLLKSEKEKLAKAHPGEETSTETEPDESASAPAGDDASASASPPAPDAGAPADEASGDGAPPTDDASASPMGDDGAPAGDPSAEGDPAADASTNPEELVPHYAKLPIEALKAHYLAAKMALAAMMGSAGGAPAGDASAAAPPAPDASAPPALKGEMKDNVEGNGENPLHASTAKSEKDSQIAELQKRLTDQEQSLAGLLTAVRTMVEAPVRKSVTSAADIEVAPTGEDVTRLDRKEIDRRLRRAAEGNLRKSDRDLINSFALGSVKVDAIAHLLK